jgi:hypothetical protein
VTVAVNATGCPGLDGFGVEVSVVVVLLVLTIVMDNDAFIEENELTLLGAGAPSKKLMK